MQELKPDYKKIFEDIIEKKCPERRHEFNQFLNKDSLSITDVIRLNNLIFGLSDKATMDFNQKHRSYDNQTILEILNYQQEQNLNNVELANHFKLSRNTVSKWRRLYSKSKE